MFDSFSWWRDHSPQVKNLRFVQCFQGKLFLELLFWFVGDQAFFRLKRACRHEKLQLTYLINIFIEVLFFHHHWLIIIKLKMNKYTFNSKFFKLRRKNNLEHVFVVPLAYPAIVLWDFIDLMHDTSLWFDIERKDSVGVTSIYCDLVLSLVWWF